MPACCTFARAALIGAASALLLATCREENPTMAPLAPHVPAAPSFATITNGQVLVGAGNIARCTSNADEATAKLLDAIPGTVFADGDLAYDNGASDKFTNCYTPTWGRHKARTRPTPGEIEYKTSGASAYFNYFGAAAGTSGLGYYSYDLGDWHVVVLNSENATGAGSAQEQWLRADLAASSRRCTLAYWHSPRFHSGGSGNTVVQPLWDDLSAAAPTGRRRARGRRRHCQLQLDRRRGHGGAAGRDPGNGVHVGRQRLSQRLVERLRELLHTDLGSPQGAHPSHAGHSRLQHVGRFSLFRLFRERRRDGGEGLLQLRPGGVARRGAQFADRYQCHVRATRVAEERPRRGVGTLHRRPLLSPALQLGYDARRHDRRAGRVASVVRRACGAGAERARA